MQGMSTPAWIQRGQLLTPQEVPPLAAELRARAEDGFADTYTSTRIPEQRAATRKPRTSLGWDGEWYRDDAKKCIHGQFVLAGMERARQQGKRIGRPSVMERDGFSQRFMAAVERLEQGVISRRQAARELAIGYATLKRLLDARLYLTNDSEQAMLVPTTTCDDGIVYDGILVTY